MKILVVGGGGREHALVWKLKQSRHVDQLYCAPGNAGIAQDARCVDIAATDTQGLLHFAIQNKIDLTIVGPEAPLVAGIVDEFEANGLSIFGPSQRAAELEGSKSFAKYIMNKYNVPTADSEVFDEFDEAQKYLGQCSYPIVVKADGLAAGKGVIICENREKAAEALKNIMLEKVFGDAGDQVIIEEFLTGQEVSVLGISDGEHLVYLVPSQDHKRIFDNDQGPNTGGMGAYAPTPVMDEQMMQRVQTEVMEPVIKGMALEDRPYRGILYGGIILTEQGPKVLEFNCRFGDPETQAVLPLADVDLVEAILSAQQGKLDEFNWKNLSKYAVCVVISSGGYPGSYETGKTILGLDNSFEQDVIIFHAGTRREDSRIVTAGGRVLGVTALDDTLEKAIDKVYRAVGKITFDGAYYRKDIAAKALNLKKRTTD